jgi:phosphate starvation-inducible PhoH-like protein
MLDAEEIERSVARQTIEVAPLAYMRGRTLSNAFVILDEAQNTTTEQMFMLLTRMGPNSKCVVTGDVTQIDLPPNKRSGLVEALQALKSVQGISFVYFNERDVVRHELVRAVINAYQQHRSPANLASGSRK